MKPFRSISLMLILSASLIAACSDHRVHTPPVVCTDTLRSGFTLEPVSGYHLRSKAPLSFLVNIFSFNDQKEFEELFEKDHTPANSNTAGIDFNLYWIAAIVTDNKMAVFEGSSQSNYAMVETLIRVDTPYVQSCKLTIPFAVGALRTSSMFTKRKFALYRIPRSAPFNDVYVLNRQGSMSRTMPVPR